jgi:hypothetical protein
MLLDVTVAFEASMYKTNAENPAAAGERDVAENPVIEMTDVWACAARSAMRKAPFSLCESRTTSRPAVTAETSVGPAMRSIKAARDVRSLERASLGRLSRSLSFSFFDPSLTFRLFDVIISSESPANSASAQHRAPTRKQTSEEGTTSLPHTRAMAALRSRILVGYNPTA